MRSVNARLAEQREPERAGREPSRQPHKAPSENPGCDREERRFVVMGRREPKASGGGEEPNEYGGVAKVDPVRVRTRGREASEQPVCASRPIERAKERQREHRSEKLKRKAAEEDLLPRVVVEPPLLEAQLEEIDRIGRGQGAEQRGQPFPGEGFEHIRMVPQPHAREEEDRPAGEELLCE